MKVKVMAALMFVATGCARPSPIAGWSGSDLCGGGGRTIDAPLVPRPLEIRRLEAPIALATNGAALSTRELEVPAWDRFLAESGLEDAPRASASLIVHVLSEGSVSEIEARCATSLPKDPEAYFLVVRRTGGFEAAIAARGRQGASRGLSTLREILDGGAREAWIRDAPAQSRRGVLEGFYGPPWSLDERLEIVRFAWSVRMNTYVWSPKGDIESRILWRYDYDRELLRELEVLVAEGDRLDVEVCLALSPGAGILYGDPNERAIVVSKLTALASTGAHCLVLAFDDISRDLRPEDAARYPGGIGEAQADLLADVFARVHGARPDLHLGFVPTDYSNEALDAHPEYAVALADALPAEVFAGWTGPKTVSPELTAEDVAHAASLWKRAPYVGDNYPVVDGNRTSGAVQLGPVIGRDIGAVKAASGWVANGMPLPHASEIAFGTIADLAWNPDAYDPEASWARTMLRIAGSHADALRRFAENARASVLDPRPIEPLAALGDAWLAAFPADSPDLAAELGALRELADAMQALGPLGEELAPWSRALSGYGRAGLSAMDLAADVRSGRPVDPSALDALKTAAADLANGDARIANDAGDRLLSGAIDRLSNR